MKANKPIKMVDLSGQYLKLKDQIDNAIQEVIDSSMFIKGQAVKVFEENLSAYLDGTNVISCGNGTDALQVALMALDLPANSEIIVPAFSYAATVEVIALLGHQAVFVDVDENDFNIDSNKVEECITDKTKVIIPVHLFGQQANINAITDLAKKHDLFVIEDNAQSIGATNSLLKTKAPVGNISTTSFFPSKNLGCYGDGGAIFTEDEKLAQRIRMICNHGQSKKYYHEIIGINSRLDSIQAAILNEKLKCLDQYIEKRKWVAHQYKALLKENEQLILPLESGYSDHCYHQFTLRVKNNKRDDLKAYLLSEGIPSMIYYPVPLHHQNAYKIYNSKNVTYPISEKLCTEVLSLPIHTEMDESTIAMIAENIINFLNK